MYETVVVSTVVMHFAFIAYVLAGGFLALRWRRTMWLHVPAVIWAWEFVKFATGPVGQALIGESRLFVPVLRSAINSHGFANAHRRVGNLAVLSEGPAYSEGLPVTPAWEKIAALMDRYFGPVLRGSRPATSLTGLSQAVDEVLRNP